MVHTFTIKLTQWCDLVAKSLIEEYIWRSDSYLNFWNYYFFFEIIARAAHQTPPMRAAEGLKKEVIKKMFYNLKIIKTR